MNRKPSVILGMSGGVDSSVAASLLVEQGYDVRGVTLQVWEDEDEQTRTTKRWEERGCCKVGLAKHVAQLVGIPHEVVDTHELFRTAVIDDFTSGYLNGTTPNPCVRCNERVKFGALYDYARSQGADYVATGHYSKILRLSDNTLVLGRGADRNKDQSYFLYRISPAWLPHILFPLGDLQKARVWEHAKHMGLPTEELQESQEICFVTQGDYRKFLQQHAPHARQPGPFMDQSGRRLGEHQGLAFYTLGQRKGLGIATGEPLYVQRLIPERNTVVLGRKEDLDTWDCLLADLNIFARECLGDGAKVRVKCRYAGPPVDAVLSWEGSDAVRLTFAHAQRSLSPGQSAVFYDADDHVLGGGIIQRTVSPPDVPAQADTLLHARS